MKLIKWIPNLLTLFNLLLGILACIHVLESTILVFKENAIRAQVELYPSAPDYTKLLYAAGFVILAAIIDFADGFIARFLKAESAIGKQLDSLADMVTFGVVPGLFLYKLFELAYASVANVFSTDYALLLPGLLVALAAAYRLAKFNVTDQAKGFKGLPTPAMALFVIALPFFLMNDSVIGDAILYLFSLGEILNAEFYLPVTLWLITLLLSLLMVSNIPMIALKFESFGIKENLSRYLLLILAAAIIIFFTVTSTLISAFPFVILLYILLSVTTAKFKKHEVQG